MNTLLSNQMLTDAAQLFHKADMLFSFARQYSIGAPDCTVHHINPDGERPTVSFFASDKSALAQRFGPDGWKRVASHSPGKIAWQKIIMGVEILISDAEDFGIHLGTEVHPGLLHGEQMASGGGKN